MRGFLSKFLKDFLFSKTMSLIAMLCCSGCASIDSFSSRASTFNQATANSKTETILTNIVRAAYAEPLQFSDVTSAQGNALAEASISAPFTVPTRGGFGIPLVQQFITPQPSLRANSTNQFNVTNLNNQEFYNGLQTPLSAQQLSTFLLSGYDPFILLMLSVSEIEVYSHGRRTLIRNLPRTSKDFGLFYTAVNRLVDAGFSAEQIEGGTAIGPALSPMDAKEVLPDLIRTTASDPLSMRKQSDGTYQITKKSGSTRFCFDPVKAGGTQQFGRELYSVPQGQGLRRLTLGYDPKPIPYLTIELGLGDACGSKGGKNGMEALERSLKFRTRSVEGIFQFLGELSRAQVGLNGEVQDYSIPGEGWNLFQLRLGGTPGGIEVWHKGVLFSVAVDPSGKRDGSSRTLQLLASLLALQSSAKNFPSQNLITVVGP